MVRSIVSGATPPSVMALLFATEPILHKKYQNTEMEKYSARETRKSSEMTNPFSCLWTFAKTGCASATSSNLKWITRSLRFPTGASLVLSRSTQVLSMYFYIIAFWIHMNIFMKDSAFMKIFLNIFLNILLNIFIFIFMNTFMEVQSGCTRWGTAPGCCSCGWQPSTLSPVLEARTTPSGASSLASFLLEMQNCMFAHKSPSGAWSLASPCPSWPSPSSASPRCFSSSSAQNPSKIDNVVGVVHRRQQVKSSWRLRRCLPAQVQNQDHTFPQFHHWFHSGGAVWTLPAARSELIAKPAKPMRTWFSEDSQVL